MTFAVRLWPLLCFALVLFAGCGSPSNTVTPGQATPAPLSPANVNLIFVVSAPLVNALLKSYGSSQTVAGWADGDYDSIWMVTIDGSGNLTIDNSHCKGINSAKLPATAPAF